MKVVLMTLLAAGMLLWKEWNAYCDDVCWEEW